MLGHAAEADRRKDTSPLRVLLAAGPKDHGPGEHDYPAWQKRWTTLLGLSKGVQVANCQGFPTPAQFVAADVIVFYSNNPGWSDEKAKDLDAFLARGGGAIWVHYAVDGHKAPEALADRIGLAWKGGGSKFRHGDLDLTFPTRDHPITRGFTKLTLIDESYWQLVGDRARIRLLATAKEDDADQPLLWVREHGEGRVFVSIPGHYNWTFDDPLFRVILLRAIAWTGKKPSERLVDLATIGARVSD